MGHPNPKREAEDLRIEIDAICSGVVLEVIHNLSTNERHVLPTVGAMELVDFHPRILQLLPQLVRGVRVGAAKFDFEPPFPLIPSAVEVANQVFRGWEDVCMAGDVCGMVAQVTITLNSAWSNAQIFKHTPICLGLSHPLYRCRLSNWLSR